MLRVNRAGRGVRAARKHAFCKTKPILLDGLADVKSLCGRILGVRFRVRMNWLRFAKNGFVWGVRTPKGAVNNP